MSSTPPVDIPFPIPEFPSLKLLAGPQLLGLLFSWGLQGVLTTQVYIYHLYFPDDRTLIKLFVYLVLLWEWVQTCLVTQVAWEIYVLNFGNVLSVIEDHSSWFSVAIMSAIVAFAVQSYYAWRIWKLSRSRLLLGAISFVALGSLALGVTAGITIHADPSKVYLNKPIVVTGVISGAVVDVAITAAMTYFLLRSKTGLRQSDDIVNRLVRLVVETGALTATVAIVYAVMMFQDYMLYECPALVLPKLYSNTLLVSLNNRAFVRGEMLGLGKAFTSTHSSGGGSAASRSRALVESTIGARETLRIDVSRSRYDSDVGTVDRGRSGISDKPTFELTRMGASLDDVGSGRGRGREDECVYVV